MPTIHPAQSDTDIERCFVVMAQLRPQLRREQFVSLVRRLQAAAAYELVGLEQDGQMLAVAGYRVTESMGWSRYLYVDDLVTAESVRGQGWGQLLMDWLIEEAKRRGCQQLHLDSGVHRFAAHGFYLKNRFQISCHHFSRALS
jgi:GNAT superfamily N-acetyltransferase